MGLEAEFTSVPLEGLLLLGSVVVPVGDNDVFAGAWQRIGDISAIHPHSCVEAGSIAIGHLLSGIVVAVELNSVELPWIEFAIGEKCHVVGKEFMLSVGLVPVAHLHLPQMIFFSYY